MSGTIIPVFHVDELFRDYSAPDRKLDMTAFIGCDFYLIVELFLDYCIRMSIVTPTQLNRVRLVFIFLEPTVHYFIILFWRSAARRPQREKLSRREIWGRPTQGGQVGADPGLYH